MTVYLLWKIYRSPSDHDDVVGVFELRSGAESYIQDYPEDFNYDSGFYYFIDMQKVL